jgi:hypothetical protein
MPSEVERLSGWNICREAFMAKHRKLRKNNDPQLIMSGASGAAGT